MAVGVGVATGVGDGVGVGTKVAVGVAVGARVAVGIGVGVACLQPARRINRTPSNRTARERLPYIGSLLAC